MTNRNAAWEKRIAKARARERRVRDIPLKDKGDRRRVLEVKIYYDEGGVSYLSESTRQRGLYLSVTPVTVTERMRSISTDEKGVYQLLTPLSRFSAKRIAEQELDEKLVNQMIGAVLSRNQFELAEQEKA